jgi:hypothetical protein
MSRVGSFGAPETPNQMKCAHPQHGTVRNLLVVVFKRVAADDKKDKVAWVYAGLKRPHTHDVRALAVAPAPDDPSTSLLFSAGNDSQVSAMCMPILAPARWHTLSP